MARIRKGLLNQAQSAVKQKERLKRSAHLLSIPEQKRVAFEVDRACARALYYMRAFIDSCESLRRQFKLTHQSFDEDIVPRKELMEVVATNSTHRVHATSEKPPTPGPVLLANITTENQQEIVVTLVKGSAADMLDPTNPQSIRGKCVVCLDSYAEVMLYPCNHLCLCKDCCDRLENQNIDSNHQCPICRDTYETPCQIYSVGSIVDSKEAKHIT